MTRGKLKLLTLCFGGLVWVINPCKATDSELIEQEKQTISPEQESAWEEYLPCVIWDREHHLEMSKEEVTDEPQTSQEAVLSGMAPICEAMVETEVPRSPLAAEVESYSQSLDQKAESESVNEQTASEEAPIQQPTTAAHVVEAVPESSSTEAETVPPEESIAVYQEATPVYIVDGERLDHGVAEYLYRRLCESNIGWFYQYALLVAYQESSFNPLAINPNGRDFGLFQYRIEYYPELDWSNPYAQVDFFVSQMTTRASSGCDVYTMISRHNMSDYGPYNQVYVDQVMGHQIDLQR